MSSIGLMFVGAALLLNGLGMLGKVDAKSAAPFNLFVGTLQVAIPFYLAATAIKADDVLLASGIFLFGFTYLYVGVATLAGHAPVGIGWYSAWVSVMAAAFGVTEIVKFHDATTSLLWFQWVVLWGLFFLTLGLGIERLTTLTGAVTVIMGFTTATIPGFIMLLGGWVHVPPWALGVVIAATVVVLVPVAWTSLRTPRPTPVQRSREDVRVPVPS